MTGTPLLRTAGARLTSGEVAALVVVLTAALGRGHIPVEQSPHRAGWRVPVFTGPASWVAPGRHLR
jgi:hypothetical protein